MFSCCCCWRLRLCVLLLKCIVLFRRTEFVLVNLRLGFGCEGIVVVFNCNGKKWNLCFLWVDRFGHVNYEDPHFNVGLPVFTIHGNHDDPAGVVWVSIHLFQCSFLNFKMASDGDILLVDLEFSFWIDCDLSCWFCTLHCGKMNSEWHRERFGLVVLGSWHAKHFNSISKSKQNKL